MISIVAVLGIRTRAIGKNNKLLWQLPEDLKHFKQLTNGHPVIMGRNTWNSLPQSVRPLPGRTNIVVAHEDINATGAQVFHSLDEAFQAAREANGGEEVFVIGGGILYASALPYADRLYLTLVDDDADGDTFFPDYREFTTVIEDKAIENDPPYRFVTLKRA